MRPRSLFDSLDLPTLRVLARSRGGLPGLAVTVLDDAGVVAHDPADPDWADRDRVVAGALRTASAMAQMTDLTIEPGDAQALGLAHDLARSSSVAGGIFRVFCVLDRAAVEHGRTWEAAVEASREGISTLTVVAFAEDGPSPFEAAGWWTWKAAGDLVEVLRGMDQALHEPDGPRAILVTDAGAAGGGA